MHNVIYKLISGQCHFSPRKNAFVDTWLWEKLIQLLFWKPNNLLCSMDSLGVHPLHSQTLIGMLYQYFYVDPQLSMFSSHEQC